MKTLLIVTILGVPAFIFLALITWGMILVPIVGLLALAPLAALNYVLWGRRFTRTCAESSSGGADESTRP